MHPAMFAAFDRICSTRGARGNVLEIGATPDAGTLPNLPALAGCTLLGIDLSGPHIWHGTHILLGTANDMRMFDPALFDVILCNFVLEHDARFWLTLAEIRRVGKPGALVVLGVPGYLTRTFGITSAPLLSRIGRLPLPRRFRQALDSAHASTPALNVHNYPGDYYRFSMQAVAKIFLAGMREPHSEILMRAPRIIGAGLLGDC